MEGVFRCVATLLLGVFFFLGVETATPVQGATQSTSSNPTSSAPTTQSPCDRADGSDVFDVLHACPSLQPKIQSRKHSAVNSTHWKLVDQSLKKFESLHQQFESVPEFVSSMSDLDPHFVSLLQLEDTLGKEREKFQSSLQNNKFGQLMLEMAEHISNSPEGRPSPKHLKSLGVDPIIYSSFLEHAATSSTTTRDTNPSNWPCTCGEEKCACEVVCETCSITSSDGDDAASQSTASQVLIDQRNADATNLPSDDSPFFAAAEGQPEPDRELERQTDNFGADDAEADLDAPILDKKTKQNVVVKKSVGTAKTIEEASLLQMEIMVGEGPESGNCDSCKQTCSCVSDCDCEMPAPNKDQCKAQHALLLQCEISCLPIFPFDLICYAFSNCLNKCKVEAVEGFPDVLAKICKWFCGCRKFCIAGH